jgi:hypothetical protein
MTTLASQCTLETQATGKRVAAALRSGIPQPGYWTLADQLIDDGYAPLVPVNDRLFAAVDAAVSKVC